MVLEVIIGDALVHLLCTPFRRIMMIQAVHFDLEEEHFSYFYSLRHRRTRQKGEKDKKKKKSSKAKSPFDFRHMGEAVCFLYEVGGLRFFFCGGLLDVASVFLKYYVQVWLIIPVFRRLPPLSMSSFVLFSTFIHTAVMFVPVASIQCLVSALVLNKVTDFTVECAPAPDTSLSGRKIETQNRLFSFFRCSFFSHILAAMRLSRCKENRGNGKDCNIGSDSYVPATFNKVSVMSESDENEKKQLVEDQSDEENSITEDSNVLLHQNGREDCVRHAVVVGSSDFFETFSGTKNRRRFSCATTPPVLSVVPLQATKRVRVSAMTLNSHSLVPPFLSSRAGVTAMEEQRGVRSTSSSRRSSLQDGGSECGQWSFRSNPMQDQLGKKVDPLRRHLLEPGDASSPYHTSGGEASLTHFGAHSCGATRIDGNSEKRGETFTPRFSRWIELTEALYYEFPVWRFLKKVIFIEFLSRYFSSVVCNMLVSRLYSYLAAKNSSSVADGGGVENLRSCVQSSLLRRGAPLAVAIGVSLITYPLATLPFLHFMRLAHYEYLRRESAVKRLDAELNGYLSPSDQQSLTITPVVFSTPASPAFHTSFHRSEVSRSGDITDMGIGPYTSLQNEMTMPFVTSQEGEKEKGDTLGDASANTSFSGSRGSLDAAGGDVWLQVKMNDDELLEERNLYSTHPRNVKTSISLGNWWVESMVLKLYHIDVRGYLSFLVNRHGFLALYNGWGGHVSQLICQSIAGVIIQEAIAKLYPM